MDIVITRVRDLRYSMSKVPNDTIIQFGSEFNGLAPLKYDGIKVRGENLIQIVLLEHDSERDDYEAITVEQLTHELSSFNDSCIVDFGSTIAGEKLITFGIKKILSFEITKE